ncbi:hypothetical protein, variant 1 [Aphanomyces invadans]|uniref:F-box domain-containing protein n=1 Tax=Aphanomyces invadans TaxID=157072 RepID=A0A024UG12_9STRA|nr:hypothetical protein, variant 1 [Aphanomyces invadans]ETW04568.1 hypothetical protein, variant 1 [Aphanomyces invadans]|eukprot:XP_008866008.1 hypothetical protein, variant 1 [Aphanomyces invadans]
MTSTMLEAFFHGYTQRATEDVLTVVAVKSVLDDMIADIETWIHETERNALTTELEKANAALAQYAIAERIHWDEKQNVLQTVHLLQLQGRTLVRKLKTEAELVAQDVLNKARLEKELAESKEKIASYATLSRELSRSQREVRELHRRLGIQNVLNPSAIQEKAGPPPNHDPTSTPTGLASLSDATLLNIFSNVDAMDVLAMSLTSKAWKSRIHVMFGLKKEKLQRRTALPPTIPKPLNVKPSLRPVPALDKSQLARADDMIKSFNAKEMKFFHDLMIRMKTLEKHLTALQAEKEDLAARLQGAENVRDFLMEKLTDVEDALALAIEDKALADAQSNLDREVMAYLDAKSQDADEVLQLYVTQNQEAKGHDAVPNRGEGSCRAASQGSEKSPRQGDSNVARGKFQVAFGVQWVSRSVEATQRVAGPPGRPRHGQLT